MGWLDVAELSNGGFGNAKSGIEEEWDGKWDGISLIGIG